MLVTLLGIFISSKYEQFLKAEVLMLVTPSGIVICVKLLHPEKAFAPMLVTLLGIFIVSKHEQFSKAESPMLITPSGIFIFVNTTIF